MNDNQFNPVELIISTWNKIPLKTQSITINLAISIFLLFLFYCFYLIVNRKLELSKPRYFLRFSFHNPSDEAEYFGKEFFTIFSKLHSTARDTTTTFEIHKQENFEGYIFSSLKVEVLENIKLDLQKIHGIKFDEQINLESNDSPIKSDSKSFQYQLLAQNQFGNFRTDEFDLVKTLVEYLKNLSSGTQSTNPSASIIFALKPNRLQNMINSLITKLNNESWRRSREFNTSIDQNIVRRISRLEVKNNFPLFSCRITIIGSTRQIAQNLSSCFNILADENRFNSRISNFTTEQIRYVPKSNLFSNFNQSAFGSNLNTKELSNIIQIDNFGDLKKYIVLKSIAINELKVKIDINSNTESQA